MCKNLFVFSIRKYDETLTGFRKLGPQRYAVDLFKISFIFEFWWLRDRK